MKWLEHRALEVSLKTVTGDRYQCEKYIIPRLGKVKLGKLNVLKVQDMMLALAGEVSPACANRSRKVLKNALGQAVRWQLITKNPVDAVRKLKEDKQKMILWTYEEAAAFLATAKGHRHYSLFLLTMSTGVRISEVMGLRWQDVNDSSIHIRHTATQVKNKFIFAEATKTDHSNRIVTIPEDVVAALVEHRRAQQGHYAYLGFTPSHNLVFDSLAATPISPRNLDRTYHALQKRAGVPHAKFHDLRHWHASMLIEEGWDIRLIAKRLGHADPSITLRIYAHLFNKQKQEKAISLGTILPMLDEGEPAYLN